MDIDLKIGAVFSLADNEDGEEPKTGSDNIDTSDPFGDCPEYLLPDREENDEVDIMPNMNQEKPASTGTSLLLTDHMNCAADQESHNSSKSSNESTSILDDPDIPPSLLLENTSSLGLPTPPLISSIDSMSPPILQPEEPIKRAITPEKKSCKKIDPCYIVLTKIDPFVKQKPFVSSRKFKRLFVECSNMCKKVLFGRHLKAGKDVFNVKTPSKQKDYLIYLIRVEQERLKRNKMKLTQCPQIRDIIRKHDLKVEARKKATGKPAHPRVRRTVSRLPKDFADRPVSPVSSETGEINDNQRPDLTELSREELAKLQNAYVKRKHKLSLNTLKRQIAIKRSLNLNLKRTKRNRMEGFVTFLKSDVTSSVSGRVRKVNPRYVGDFALSKKDIDEKRFVDVAHAQLKRAKSASTRKVEEINKSNDHLLKKQRRRFPFVCMTDTPDMGKKVKVAEVVIDNPEKEHVRSFHFRPKKLKKEPSRCKIKSDQLKLLLNAPPVVVNHESILMSKDKTIKTKEKMNENDFKDGVLIQDLPREENVISDFLQNVSFGDRSTVGSTPLSSIETRRCMTSENLQSDQYVLAKELLKKSLDERMSKNNTHDTHKLETREIPAIKQEGQSFNLSLTQANEKERYKQLRMPENVQKLFANKEIKQEPIDEGYGVTASCSSDNNGSKVITVAYSNGTYRTVPVSSSSPGKAVSTQSSKVDKAGMNHAPILVNTQQGLRYLVPKQAIASHTLPSYSEAIKAKFHPVMSEKSSISSIASQPSVILNTSTSLHKIPSDLEQNKHLQRPFHSNQSTNQIGVQSKVLTVLPAVLQVPVQNAMSATSSLLRPSIATQTIVVSQPYVKNSQQAVCSVSSISSNTATKQTHTVVHKVSPVMQKQTVLNHSQQRSSAPVNQQTVIVSNTVGIQKVGNAQSQKNIEKCKFYLLKIDGKNVLIPIDGDQAQPKAFVMNSEITSENSQVRNQNTTATVSNLTNIASHTGTRPSLIGLPTYGGVSQSKPTLAVVPNMKQVSNILPTQFTFVSNATNLPQNKSLFQTVTLTNIGAGVGGNGSTPTGVNGVTTSSVATTVKSTNAYDSVVTSGNYKLTTQPLSTKASSIQKHSQPNNPLTVVPFYLSPATSSTVSGKMQATVNTSAVGLLAERNSLFVPQIGQIKSVIDNTNQPAEMLRNVLMQNRTLLDKLPVPSFPRQNKDNVWETGTNNKNVIYESGELCEKSGIFTPVATTKENEQEMEEKPQAFKEAVTAREDRLRRLKELLKEKQKAVEEIRSKSK